MPGGKTVIKVDQVHKTFRLPHERVNSLKSMVVNFYRRKRNFERQHVLKGVSFEIKKGEFFGIVGRNGSGKSTLLKLLAGIYTPDSGSVDIQGRLIPFIELGVGFNPELTGRENVFLNGALLGFSRSDMMEMYKDIVEFAELERFMDQKLKNYSSGMQVRLAFSIAIRAQGDILLIDEVLAVGDAAFQSKCFDYFYELKKKGATVVFVSHDRGSLERFCDRGVLVDGGEIVTSGPIKKILNDYSAIVLEELEDTSNKQMSLAERKSAGNGFVTIGATYACDQQGRKKTRFAYGDVVQVYFEAKAKRRLVHPVLGVTVWQKNLETKPIFASNTLIEGIEETGVFEPGETVTFTALLPSGIADGEYVVEPAVANSLGTVFYDQKPGAARLFINGSNNPYSLLSGRDSISVGHKKVSGEQNRVVRKDDHNE